MKRRSYLIALVAAVSGVMIAAAGADVWPVRLEPQDSEHFAPLSPALVLADGGLEFPDGSVQTTAAAVGPPAPVPRTAWVAFRLSGNGLDHAEEYVLKALAVALRSLVAEAHAGSLSAEFWHHPRSANECMAALLAT